MDYESRLRDGTNLNILVDKSTLLKSNAIDLTITKNLKSFYNDKENMQRFLKSTDETGDSFLDISSLSVTDEDQETAFKLPDSQYLDNEQNRLKFIANMKNRRWKNRVDASAELQSLEECLDSISFDSVTGERYVMESLDYRMDLEISKFPLGRNFLEDTNITPRVRREVIDSLFSASELLKTDRYTVSLAVAMVDRYVKKKKCDISFTDYKNAFVSCWFLACKFDLVYYPSIEDMCHAVKIRDVQLLIDTEVEVLQTIDFYVSTPTAIDFLRPLTLMKQRDGISHNIAKFFIELSLYVYDLAAHPSHLVAAASYCLAMALSFRITSIESTWTSLMKIFTGLDVADIKPVISMLGQEILTTNFAKELPALNRAHQTVIDVLKHRHLDIMRLSRP